MKFQLAVNMERMDDSLDMYEAPGCGSFVYYASLGLGHAEQQRSLEPFCSQAMPAFQ